MKEKTDTPRKQQKPLSLFPLKFEEALDIILKAKPKKRAKKDEQTGSQTSPRPTD
jgi:hypothetical protein